MNHGTAVKVKALSEGRAIDLGSNLLGEGIIFVVAAVLILLEYKRQASKEQAKEDIRFQEKEDLTNAIRDLELLTKQNNIQLN